MALKERFEALKIIPGDINEHLETLKHYTELCEHVTEFGMREGTSTTALLMGKPKVLITYDIAPSQKDIDFLSGEALKQGTDFHFKKQSTLDVEIAETDFLFIDTEHTYNQLIVELRQADKVKKFIAFHDTVSFGKIGERGGNSVGILPAINEFLLCHPEWQIEADYKNNNGLLILKKVNNVELG
jgi:hypothetical protein